MYALTTFCVSLTLYGYEIAAQLMFVLRNWRSLFQSSAYFCEVHSGSSSMIF